MEYGTIEVKRDRSRPGVLPSLGRSALLLAVIAAALTAALSCSGPQGPGPGAVDRTAPTSAARAHQAASSPLVLRYFWAEGCGACTRAAPFLSELEGRFPQLEIERYEVSGNREHADLYRRLAADHDTRAAGVPAFFVAELHWIGFRPDTGPQIAAAVQQLSAAGTAGSPTGSATSGGVGEGIDLPWFGAISFAALPAFAVTAAIAVVDGFNPCSLWVLTFLIGLMVRTGSRGRTLLVGMVFLAVTAAVYGLFMLGLLRVFAAAAELVAVRIGVAVLAVAMGLVNLKDFFAFKVGFSLTVPQRFQGLIARQGRSLFERSGAPLALVAATALFALGIGVVELPCTAGFPVIWSQYVASLGSSTLTFWALFALYLALYLGDEILLVAVSLAFMRRVQFGENQARTLKLLGGTIMAALGVCFLFAPEMTRSLSGVAVVFGAALIVSAAILGGERALTALRRSAPVRLHRAQRGDLEHPRLQAEPHGQALEPR